VHAWFKVRPRGHVGHRHAVEKVLYLSKAGVLGLHVFGKVTTLTNRRVLKLEIAQEPLLPSFSRVNYRILVVGLDLGEKVGDIVGVDPVDQVGNEHFVVDVAVVELLAHLLVGLSVLKLSVFHMFVNREGYFVEPSQDGVVHCLELTARNEIGVSVHGEQVAHHSEMISLGCSHKGRLPSFCGQVDICSVLFD